ncbi:rhodopsin, GQ-coupled [Patella vulgata]|uniref:rhodopsin, GQ-coupled n=1 Tax=Patella vulgata TaxID=6465 RepID=UPI00218030EC|nr:rhodopsin, GQ-coupled [Patella vulgata]
MYVVNLASTELIMCLVNFPMLIWACLNGSWPLNNISCCFDYLSRDTANIAFIICLFIFCFVIQFIIIMYCYSSMLVFICRHERMFISSHFMKADRASRKKLKLELKVTRLVLIVISSFCLSWLPFSVIALIGAFGNTALVTPLTSILPGVLAKTSTAVNPILYAMSHPKFQMSLCSSCPSSFSRRNMALSNIYHATLCKTGEHFGNHPLKL